MKKRSIHKLLLVSCLSLLLSGCATSSPKNAPDASPSPEPAVSSETADVSASETPVASSDKPEAVPTNTPADATSSATKHVEPAADSADGTKTIIPTYTSGRGDLMQGGFVVHAPTSWLQDVVYEMYETDTTYGISFYETNSHRSGWGGHLFSLIAFPEGLSYEDFPSYDLIGKITSADGYTEDLVAIYPTDVQFDTDQANRYQALTDEMHHIMQTITANEGFTYERISQPE